MRQFYLPTDPATIPGPGDRLVLDAEESHHLKTVLRGGRTPEIDATDGRGLRMIARPVPGGSRKGPVEVEIISVVTDPEAVAEPHLVLACAVVKGRRFEWALEKAVEVGVHRIIPLVTEHTVVEPGRGKEERWRTILRTALKQSGRSWLPELDVPCSIDEALERSGRGLLYRGDVPEKEDAVNWPSRLRPIPKPLPERLILFIGPEGGWTRSEAESLERAGAVPLTLGPHVLRTETAAVCGLSALQSVRSTWLRETSSVQGNGSESPDRP